MTKNILFILIGIALVRCSASRPLSISDEDGMEANTSSSTVPVGSVSTTVNLSLSTQGSFDFGAVQVGSASVVAQSFVLSNLGSTTGNGLTVSLQGEGYSIASNSCGTVIAAHSTCAFSIRFLPTRVASFSGKITIGVTQGNPINLSLSGAGSSYAIGHLTADMISDPGQFGPRLPGDVVMRLFYVVNDGSAPLTNFRIDPPQEPQSGSTSPVFILSSSSVLPGDSVTPACSSVGVLVVGARCGFAITFNPVLPPGVAIPLSYSAVIPIYFRDVSDRVLGWNLSGTVVTATVSVPVLTLSSVVANGAFADVAPGESKKSCVTLSNPNLTSPALIQQLNASLGDGFLIDMGVSCPNIQCSLLPNQALAPNTSCDIGVSYSPMIAEPASVALSIGYYDGVSLRTVQTTLTGSNLKLCTLPKDYKIKIFNVESAGSSASGQTTFTLPNDAKKIVIKLTAVHVDDYAPILSVNGTKILDLGTEGYQSSRVLVYVNITVPFIAGKNTLSGSCKNQYVGGPASMEMRTLNGSFYTAGACPTFP